MVGDAHGVLDGTGPLPAFWNRTHIRFDIYDWGVNPRNMYAEPVAHLAPGEFWDGWRLIVGEKVVEEFFCERLESAMAQTSAYLVSHGIIEDY